MDRTFEFPATPSMPLFPLSPERINGLPHSPSHPSFGRQPYGNPSHDFGHPEFGAPGDFGGKDAFANFGEDYTSKSPFAISYDSPFKLPSLPGSPTKHSRTNSEVQAMVSRFNTLDIKDHAELRRKDAAALKRAELGREEAEAETKTVKQECTALRAQVDEGKERESRVVKRLDGVMDELHRTKETQSHAQTLYEKEIRRARKEAFKSSSALVKLQEELKAARNTLRLVQSDLELERDKVTRREQESFNAQYQLVGVQEELDRAQTNFKIVEQERETLKRSLERAHTNMKTVEEEREALKTSLKEEEVARIAAEGRIALPPAVDEDEEDSSSPATQQPTPRTTSPGKRNIEIARDSETLKDELEKQKRRLAQAEEELDFMKMECQFGCCSCRIAERQGRLFLHDGTFDREVQGIKSAVAEMFTPPASVISDQMAEQVNKTMGGGSATDGAESMSPKIESGMSTNDLLTADLIVAEPTVDLIALDEQLSPVRLVHVSVDTATPCPSTAHLTGLDTTEYHIVDSIHNSMDPRSTTENPPETPMNKAIRTVTTTTTIPLADHSTLDYSTFATPTGLTREQAIEKLRQRRGRARSVAGTPKRIVSDGTTPRRDISAPEMRVKATPRSVSRGQIH